MMIQLAWFFLVLVMLWVSGAWYFDVGRRGMRGWTMVAIWWAMAVAAFLLIRPELLAFAVIAAGNLVFILWWLSIKPSHEREWDPGFAALPLFEMDGNELSARNVRCAEYPTRGECQVLWEDRGYPLNELRAVDALITYWGSNWICHPMAIFQFGDDRHLCFSIEVRYRVGDEYAVLPSLYRQNELMYVVSDERDAILRRTRYFDHIDCFLFRLQVDNSFVRELFGEYVTATNRINGEPRWYNALTSNCTTEIFSNRKEKVPWDWRMLVNGMFDKMLYDNGLLYDQLPFDELKRSCHINAAANAASREDFGRAIREARPGF